MIIVRGKRHETIDAAAFHALANEHDRVVVDLGAGDGKWALRRARANPRELVVAIEPVAENVRESSSRAARRPDRGGAPNALFVQAAVEALPGALAGMAGELWITLPWGSLMRGIILADRTLLRGIATLLASGARAHVTLNTRIFDDPVPAEAHDLPEVTPAYIQTLADAYERCGLRIVHAEWLDADAVNALGTTWAKRLSHRAPPRSVHIELQRLPDP